MAFSFPALLGTLFTLQLRREGAQAWIEASDYRDADELSTFNTEFCLASLKLICDDLLGRPLPLTNARFSHKAPRYQRQYPRDFGCPVQFSAAGNVIGFDSEWLDRRLPLADPVTHRDTLQRCHQLNREFISHQALISRVRQLLARQLPDSPGLDGLARQLRCSSRTLRRQLQEVGTSYQSLLDELSLIHI